MGRAGVAGVAFLGAALTTTIGDRGIAWTITELGANMRHFGTNAVIRSVGSQAGRGVGMMAIARTGQGLIWLGGQLITPYGAGAVALGVEVYGVYAGYKCAENTNAF